MSHCQIFISYARSDNASTDPSKRWLDRLREHLRPLELEGRAIAWSIDDIEKGELWHARIQAALNRR